MLIFGFVFIFFWLFLNFGCFFFHAQRNSFSVNIHFQNTNFHLLMHLNDIRGVFDKILGKLAYVNQSILVNAYIDKHTERGNVCYYARQFHSHLQILNLIDSLGETECLELLSRVAAGFAEFCFYIHQCR